MQNINDKLKHHELTAELINSRHGPALLLSQPSDGYKNPSSVLIHLSQLQAVCEKFGLIAGDQAAHKTIATLTRRLLVLRDRMDYLAGWLANHSDHKHADLSYEMTYATATADIAEEFCAELVETKSQDAAPIPAPPAKLLPKTSA